jgi:hypothetical protein
MRYYTHKLLLLPLLGFLAAGCSTSSNLQTSETDDVYFSSSDKVTYVEPVQVQEQQSTVNGEEYDASQDISERVSDPETYAKQRTRRDHTPYQYSYYDAPFGNPYWAYQTPFYSPGRYYSRALYMDPFYDPWYDPYYGPSMAMYDPFWPRTGISLSIGLGFGRFYNPWGYGYGAYNYGGYGYGYSPYRYYGNNYYGERVIANQVSYGRRDDRSSNTAGRNPNISRDGRSNSVISTSRSRAAVMEPGEVNRTRSSSSQRYPEGTTQPRRRQIVTPSGQSESNTTTSPTPSRSRSSNSETAPPVRRQRTEYTPSQPTESRSRSYDPAPSRTYEAPSRSSSENSSGSSSGSSSGGGRRGRN